MKSSRSKAAVCLLLLTIASLSVRVSATDGLLSARIGSHASLTVPELTIGGASVVEGNSATTDLTFAVTLSAASTDTVSVSYATAQRTAISGVDFTPATGTLLFSPGVTARTISVPIIGDTQAETNETFTVSLTAPVNATIAVATAVGTITDDDGSADQRARLVVWAGPVGVTASAGTLTKTGMIGWSSGAISARALLGGDGGMEFTTSEAATIRLAGLSHGNTDTDFSDIDFGIELYVSSRAYVTENGTLHGYVPYVAGDRFGVAVEAGAVVYRKNGVAFYTSAVEPVYPLLVDTALYSPASAVVDVVLSGDLGEDVAWTALTGATAGSGLLAKTAVAGWNAGAISTRAIRSGDGSVAFTTQEASSHKLIGLSHGNTNTDFTDVDFAILLASNGTYYVFEGGASRGVFSSYLAGDRFEVAVVDGVVSYLKNGAVFYTSAVAPAYPLLVDTALFTSDATLSDVVLGCAGARCEATAVASLERDEAGAYLVSTSHGLAIAPLVLQGTDPDPCLPLAFNLYNGETLPAGLSLAAATTANAACAGGVSHFATVSGTPTIDGVYTFTLKSSPSSPIVTFIWTVTNATPMLAAIGDRTSPAGTAVSFGTSASDANHDTLSFSATNLPAGVSINPSSGAISGTPSTGSLSPVTVTVTDGSLAASQTFVWTVTIGGSCVTSTSPAAITAGADGGAGAVLVTHPPIVCGTRRAVRRGSRPPPSPPVMPDR